MPWQVPITVDGLEYPVTFNTEGEPTQQDYDEAVQQILSQKAQAAPEPEPETPGYLSQLGSALGLGYRQMKSGVGATFNALTGDTADVAAEMAEMSKLQREQQAAQTPEDLEFMRSLEEAEKGFEQAQGPLESIGALAQYPAAVFAQPGAAFKTAVQSAPNALISGATSLAGYGLGGLVGGAATLETGPGAILGGLAGAAAGGALSNTLMEAGPSIFDVLNERTQGAASNMTADEIAAYLQQNPDIVDEGLKTGAIRGSVIGAVEALGVKGSGRLLTMPERAAARAVQKELMAQGVDVASKEAVDKALLDPALRASTKAVAETAKNQFSSAGNMARLAGASAIETGAAGAGELAAQAAAGQDISTKEAFLEMMGDAALSLPMAATTKAFEGAKYMLNPALVSDLGKASAENLAATGSTAAAEAQEGFNEAIELAMLPFTREDIRATEMPFTREDIRATDSPFTREDIRATQLPFGREDIRATEMPFSREDIRGISTPAPEVEEVGDEVTPLSEGAERNRAVIAEAAAKLRGEAPQDISAGLQAAIPQQPVETQEDAAPEIPLEESVREEPQDRIESREAEETGAGDQLLRPAEGEEEVVGSPKRQAVESVFNAIQSHLANGGDFQIPGNPPLRITKNNANQFSVSSDGDLMFKRGKKGGVIPITDVAVIGSQVGSPFDVLSLFEGREVEKPVTSDALAIAESDNGVSFERLSSLIGDRQKAADEIETLTGKDVFSAWPIVVDAVADSVSVSNGQFVDTDAKAEKLRSLYREAQEMPASKERADAIEQITLASNINQSNRDSIKRKKITPQGEPTTATEARQTQEEVVLTPQVREQAKDVYNSISGTRAGQALTQAAEGVVVGMPTSVDELYDNDRLESSGWPSFVEESKKAADDLYSSYEGVRESLRKQFGPTIRLFRYQGTGEEARTFVGSKKTLNWASTEIEARQYKGKNRTLRVKEVPIEDIVAVNVGPKGNYEEFVVFNQEANPDFPPSYKIKKKPKSATKQDFYKPKKGKDFKFDGTYEVLTPSGIRRIFKDDETGAWMDADEKSPVFSPLPFKFLGYTKSEAIELLKKEQPQTKQAAEKQTPVPLREGTGAAGVVQSEPVEGSIPTDEKVSPETESESSGNLPAVEQIDRLVQSGAKPEEMDKFIKSLSDDQFNELVASEAFDVEPKLAIKPKDTYDAKRIKRRKFVDAVNASTKEVRKTAQQVFQEEEAAAKKQQAGEEMRSKAIDSIIGASEKKKRKFGQVTNSDAIAAVAMLVSSKDVPGVLTTWTGTKEDFLRDPANQTADPEIYARIKAGELVEGFFNKGRAYVFLDGIGVSDEDMLRGEQMSVTPQVAAVRRVLLHESLVHRGIHGLPLRHRRLILNWVRQNSTPAELDDLAKLYTEYANWRNSDYEFEALAEELLAKKVDSLTEIPKDGPMARLMDILRQIWDFIVGYKREPTLSDLKSVVKLLKSGAEALSNDRLKDGGEVKLSMIAPTAGITPEMDAEYMAAVEAGDMETAQRMVDEAARAAGLNVSGVGNGITYETGDEPDSVYGERDNVMSHGGTFGFYFSDNPDVWSDYAKPRRKGEKGRVNRTFLSLKNPFRFSKEFVSYDELQTLLLDGGIALPAEVKSRLDRLVAGGFGDTQPVWKWLHPTHVGAGASYGESLKKVFTNAGYDGVIHPDSSLMEGGLDTPATSYVVFNPTQIKSADPVTRDDAGNVIPLSQRFQSESPDIRFSRPQFSSDTSASLSAGSEAARSTLYSERDMDIREAIRRAYEAMPKTNSVAVPIGELFAKTEELMPGVKQEEFSLVLQDLFEDNGAVLQEGDSEFIVTTPEGKRAGFVVVMQRAAKASRIKAEDASDASKTFQADIIEAGKGRIDTASYQGNTLKSTEAPDHNENAPELYRDAAISLVDSLLSQGHSITDIADSFQDPEFRVAVGLLGNKEINPNVAQQAELFIGAEIQNRLENSFNKERNPAKKRIIEKTLKNHKAYYTTATGIGQNLNAVGALQQDPRFKWMFMFNEAEKEMADKAKEKLDTITGGGTQPVTDTVNQSEESAADEATKQIEESVEEDEDAALFAEGEASLQGEAKSIWERMKDILRKIAFLDRLDKRDASSAKASLSEADKNTLSSLPKEERAKKRAEFVAEFIALGKIFMGEGKASDTPAQKATRQKRKKMVDTAKKRAEAGKEIEVTRIQIQSFMDELMPGYTERKSIVNEVGDALLKAAEQRKAKPRQRTAIQDFVSAIKQTLMANIRGDKISAEQPSLGMLLAKTFAQQGSEAEAFAAAWANGRKKVRGMLAEMGVEEGNLDAELDAIMPPTPTLAYAPAAARKAISSAMREAGLMRSDLLNDPAASKKAIMEKFDEAAKSANLTEEGWDKKGRALAEKAVDESIAEAKMAQERAKKVAKILSEQAEKPVSLEDFGAKLAEFRFKKDKIAELFNRAKKLAERKIQMANDQAIRVLLAAENKLAQSAFFNASEKPDTIVKAFREQVEEPMERDAFKKRMEKMLVTPEMADKLFDRAARERDNARWKKAQDLLEGPNALQNLLRQMNMARPGEQAPFSKQISWREILSQKAKTVEEYRQRIFDAISANEAFQNLSDEQKGRLSDLFSEAWESKRTDILDRMLEREIDRKRREGSLSEAAAKALQKSRNKIIELANLGGFDNDDLIKVLGEKFGIKTGFSEAEKARISELADKLQDETLNPAKRNKLAMEFAVTLAGASEIPVAEIIANWWTSSVLFGPQTIFSIGAAFVNGAYSITTIGTRRMLADLTRGDVKGAIEESILMLQGIAKYLGAFKQAGRRAWSYLWTGNVDVLGAAANDILGEINSLEELKRFKRHKLLAENLAKDPRALRRYVGMYLRFVNRLLTSLDAFNVMVTKAGTASLALRMSGMSTDNIIKAEKMLNLKAYKDQVIRDYFDNKAPTTQAEKALVDSYAEAEMYRAVDQLGGKMENADYLASESAMTMNPTGLGGFFYRSITGLDSKMKKAAEDYLEKAKRDWTTEKDLESTLFLGLAYLRQFAVQNLGGVAGYKFIRFASNKFNQGISYLPMVGLLRTLEAKGDDIKGKEAFIETIHRNQVIGAVLTLAAIAVVKALEDEPDDEERGNFWNGGWQNLTPDQKKQMLAKGQKEYTMGFKFNGRWYVFNYQNWPLNQVLAAIGSMSDQIRFSPKQWEEKGPLSKSLAGIVSGLKSTLEIPALSQLGTLVGNRLASKDPTEQTVDRLSNLAAGWVGGFVPRILKDLDFATQPELRKYKTLWEKTASHIPIYRRYVGEDYYDILGQPIKRNVIPGSREFMMGPTEPEYKILGALNSRNIFLTPANAEYRMVGKGRNRRRLTQEEADAYSLETGKGYRQMLLRYGQRALQMPTERARAFLSDKADEVRDRALKKVYRR